jgi:basic membrane protein A
MKKRWFLLVMMLILGLLLVSCGGSEPETADTELQATEAPAEAETEEEVAEEPAPAEEEEVVQEEVAAEADVEGIENIRIAVVMPSTITDLAWSQAIYDSLVRLQTEAGGEDVMEIAYTENMFNVTDAAAALRDYAAEGYDIVIAHGTQYGTSMFEIAPDFPETTFAWGTAVDVGTEQGLTNVFAYEARAEEGGYVNGVLAANLSQSGIIGVVGPVEAGDAKLYIDGFVAGAKAANPDAQVNVSYTGSFGDTALAAEAANTHIQAGADVLTGSAQQVVGAIGVAKEQGVPWIGTQSDQSSLAPDTVISSQLYNWDGVMSDIIKKNQVGEYGGTAYALTLANGGLVMQFADGLNADAVAAAQAAADEISGGMDVVAAVAGEAMAEDEAMSDDGEMMDYPEIEPIRIAIVMPSTTTD